MGTVLSFANRVRDSGQWTASERSRLEALTEHLLDGGDNLQVVFGETDDGAPWCAVTNDGDEVLVHVARVADQFLVHFVAEDVVARGANLREALGEWLSPGPEPERMGVVLPFGRTNTGPGVLVMLAIATFVEEQLRLFAPYIAEGGSWPAAASSVESATPSAEPTTEAQAEARDDAAPRAGAGSEEQAAPAASASIQADGAEQAAAPAPSGQPVQAPTSAQAQAAASHDADRPAVHAAAPTVMALELRGGDGDDVLVGGPRAERLSGGPGHDVLIGGGGRDTLDGGAGDDRIMLTSEAVALGGAGADTFVIAAPPVLNHADTLLGVIFDFSASEGDRLETAGGEMVIVPHHDAGLAATGPSSKATDQRVEVDVNGDGKSDGYVLLAAPPSHASAEDHPISLTGLPVEGHDLFG